MHAHAQYLLNQSSKKLLDYCFVKLLWITKLNSWWSQITYIFSQRTFLPSCFLIGMVNWQNYANAFSNFYHKVTSLDWFPLWLTKVSNLRFIKNSFLWQNSKIVTSKYLGDYVFEYFIHSSWWEQKSHWVVVLT